MSDFKPGTIGWYETQNVAEIEDFDPDQYGNIWYNVKFAGDAETFMWLAKNKPEENRKYYGHLEPTKSGKRMRFKTDKEPEDEPAQKTIGNKDKAYLKDLSDYPVRLYIGNLNYAKDVGLNLLEQDDRRKYLEYIQEITDELLKYSEKIRE